MVAIAFMCVLAGLGLFQTALAAGAPLGRFAWGGVHRVLPSRLRVGSVVAIAVYAAIGLVALDRAGFLDALPDRTSEVAMWIIVAYLWLATGLNAMSRSVAERAAMTPIAFVLAVLGTLIALGIG